MTWAYTSGQTTGTEQGSVNATLVLSPGWSIGEGNLLCVGITSWEGTGPVASYTVADNKSNTWHQVDSIIGTYSRCDLWYAIVGTSKGGSGVQITITPATSAYISGVVSEFSCSGTPTVIDSQHLTSANGTSLATPSVTVTGNCLLLGWIDQPGGIPVAGSGFTAPSQGMLTSGVGENGFLEYVLNATSSAAVTCGDGVNTITAQMIGVSFAEGGSSGPTTATLSGPTSGTVGVASTNFTITLDNAAQSGGVSCPISSSVGGDTITTSPVVIASGQTTGTFTITPSSTGSRNVTLGTTTPSLSIAGSPIAYNSLAASFTATPSVLLTFAGTGTTWTSGSSVSITSLTGTLSITAGTWTQISDTSATLEVSGTGTGTFTVTIDTVESPAITVAAGSVSTATGSCLRMGFA